MILYVVLNISIFKACDCCGDFHFKRVCTSKDLKVNLLVRQINVKTDAIKQNMDNCWAKLAEMEGIFSSMMTKTYRLQSQRICLEKLSGIPGEDGHPDHVTTTFNHYQNFF